jgi:hypothetical protein
MKKIFLSILSVLCLSIAAHAQFSWGAYNEEPIDGHIVKLNLPSLAATTISFQYEYLMARKKSVLLGIRYTPDRKVPFLSNVTNLLYPSGDSQLIDVGNFLNSIRFNGIAITPEFRLYLGKRSGKGFYFGPFLRYELFQTRATYSTTLGNGQRVAANLRGSLNSYGGGIQLGAQFFASRHFVIDWFFGGGYYRYSTFTAESKSNDFGFTPQDITDINAELNSLNTGFLPVKATVSNTLINLTGSLSGFSGRAGLQIGYKF